MKKNNTCKQTPMVYFDLDGTVYDLYAQDMWLERITTLGDPSVYDVDGANMYDADALTDVLECLTNAGYGIGVVSWLANGASPDYKHASRACKRAWITKYMPQATEVHIVQYGTPKHSVVNAKGNSIIVDDNADVRMAWTHGITIDATENIIVQLMSIVD